MNSLSINNLFDFEKKVVLITGSSGQLGTSFSELYLSQKAIVIGMDIIESKIKNKNFYFYKLDISNKKKVENIFHKIILKFKKIDIIINNASISVFSKFDKRKDQEINNTINSNLKGLFHLGGKEIWNRYDLLLKTRSILQEYFHSNSEIRTKGINEFNLPETYPLNVSLNSL